MAMALRLAMKGWGRTSPNPLVGAVVVRDDQVVGKGFHPKAGEPHAERIALERAGSQARGGTLYVTLEPCNHYGRTPPCTEAVLASGVRRVVIGQTDPNPEVAGGGAQRLREAGIQVEIGVLEARCRRLNEAFNFFVTRKRPFIALKLAATLDGKTATKTGDSRWITNERSRNFVHRLRGGMDSIMVGMGTVRADDPQLTCRWKNGRDPLRVVVDGSLSLTPDRKIFNPDSEAGLLVFTGVAADPEKAAVLEASGAEVVRVEIENGFVDLKAVFSTLAERRILSVLIEGGGTLAASALRAGLVDRLYFFYAPKIIGGNGAPGMIGDLGIETMAECLRIKDTRLRRFGEDFMVEVSIS